MATTATEYRVKTYDDLRAMPDDGNRYELICGEIVQLPTPNIKHQQVVGEMLQRIHPLSSGIRNGIVLIAPLDVCLSPYDVLQPDLLYVSEERWDILTEDNVSGAPDLVVEVLSDATRDRDLGIKVVMYADHGVREYWMIDPINEQIGACSLENGDIAPLEMTDETLRSRVLPGLEINRAEFFSNYRYKRLAPANAHE